MIQIASRESFYSQHPDLALNTVIYRETTRGTKNQIYIDGGDYVVLYSCFVSMKNNSDFLKMVNSAAYFQEQGESLVWFGDRLIKTGDLSETTLQWLDLSRDDELQGESNSISNHDVIYKGWITPPKITS